MKGNKNKSKKDTFKKIAQNKGVYIALFAVVMMVGFYVYARQMKEATEADVVSFDENAWQEAIAESDIEVIDIDSTVKTTTEKEEKWQNIQKKY